VAQFFLECEIFQTKFVEEIKTNISCSTWGDQRRDGQTNSTLRIKEQEKRLTLNEHDYDYDDDDDDDFLFNNFFPKIVPFRGKGGEKCKM
jgi:hypothetical protein